MNFIKTTLEDGVATLTLANPPLNILTRAVLGELRQALIALAEAPDLRVLLIVGEGKHFSAGADVGEHLPPTHRELIPEFMATLGTLAAFPLPTIAAVRERSLEHAGQIVMERSLINHYHALFAAQVRWPRAERGDAMPGIETDDVGADLFLFVLQDPFFDLTSGTMERARPHATGVDVLLRHVEGVADVPDVLAAGGFRRRLAIARLSRP